MQKKVASIIGALAIMSISPAKAGTVVWKADLTKTPDAATYSRCFQPWDNTMTQCSSLSSGGSVVYYSRGISSTSSGDPLVVGAPTSPRWTIVTRQKTAADRADEERLMTAQKSAASTVTAVRNAYLLSGMVMTRQSWGPGYKICTTWLASGGNGWWGGLWSLNDPAHRSWPPEVDNGETTFNASGTMTTRFFTHTTTVPSSGVVGKYGPAMARQWMTTCHARTTGGQTIHWLNGAIVAQYATPADGNAPMQEILTLQPGYGVTVDSSYPSMYLIVTDWHVESYP